MHIISRKKQREFCQKYADSCDALNNWYKAANKSVWNNLAQVQIDLGIILPLIYLLAGFVSGSFRNSSRVSR